MVIENHIFTKAHAILLASSLSISIALATPGFAADQPVRAAPANRADDSVGTQSATVNLINRLVERGVLSQKDSVELLLQAEAEAADLQAQTALAQAAIAKANAAELRAKISALQVAQRVVPANAVPTTDVHPGALPVANISAGIATGNQASNTLPEPTNVPENEPLPPDTVRVSYVPEIVKKQLREQIKQEVLAQAREENWAAPHAIPEWINRFKLFGDFRMRYEGIRYPENNDTGFGSSFWNFNAINTSSTPFDYTALANPPYSNVDQDRNRLRLRARLGMAVDLAEGFTSGLRLATGENNSPVTQNQSLGVASSGQGGNFSKYALWLDRAFLKYETGGQPDDDLSVSFGRFDNPFFSTSMIWADDIGFDGVAAKWKFGFGDALTPFVTLGAFPVFNTDLNFGTSNPTKFKSYDKWMFGSQLGTDLEVNNEINFKIGAAYYLFKNIEGRVSDPFTPVTAQDVGETDVSRPAFAQKGNTYIALRDILLDSTNSGTSGVTNQWQYFGLATPFHELAVTAQLDYNHFQPFQISLFGEIVNNIAFHRSHVRENGPARLLGPVNNNGTEGTFAGGNSGWNVGLKLGQVSLDKRGDWNMSLGYRRVESDAVVDGFNDSDFGGGGTNLKGFVFGGNLAVARRVWLGLRWMTAQQITGPNFNTDTVQFDINAKY